MCTLEGILIFHMTEVKTCFTPLTHYSVKRLHRIPPSRFKLPDNSIPVFSELDTAANLQQLLPLKHKPMIHSSPKCNLKVHPIPHIFNKNPFFMHNGVNILKLNC
jgi:hypothetical protein